MLQGFEKIVTITNTSSRILEPNPNRRAIIFNAVTGDVTTYSTISPVISGNGLVIMALERPYTLDYEVHGDIVTRAWFALTGGAGRTTSVFEAILQGIGAR